MIRRISLILITLIGLILSIKLTMIYIDVNFNPLAVPSFCSVDNFIDCDGVAKTDYSQFLGIPNSILGICLYLFILFLLFVNKLQNIKFLGFLKVFKNPNSYIFSLGLLAFLISIMLACISIFEINKICVLCFATYFVDFIIILLAKSYGKGLLYDIKVSIEDFKKAIEVKRYAISFIIIMTLAICVLSYTATSYALTPQLKKSDAGHENMTVNPYKASGNLLGEENAEITVNLYTDYMCPFCYNASVIVQRLAFELSNIKIEHHHLPLDIECNRYLQQQVHPGACQLARYATAAGIQGKYWDMSNALFEKMPTDEEEIIKIARKLKLNTKQLRQDANSDELKTKLTSQIEEAMNKGIQGTPTVIVNMKRYEGLTPYNEMKTELLRLGAKERKVEQK